MISENKKTMLGHDNIYTNLGSLPRHYDGSKWWWKINICGKSIYIEMTGIDEDLTALNSVQIEEED